MKKRHVLIVEDDEWLAEHYTRILGQANFSIALTTNAEAAIDATDKHMPDAILLDVFLPGANGFALLHELQSHDDLRQVPIILCTNNADDIIEEDVKMYGVAAVFDKTTMKLSDVVSALHRALQ